MGSVRVTTPGSCIPPGECTGTGIYESNENSQKHQTDERGKPELFEARAREYGDHHETADQENDQWLSHLFDAAHMSPESRKIECRCFPLCLLHYGPPNPGCTSEEKRIMKAKVEEI